MMRLDSQTLATLISPAVYAWFRDGEYIYIGYSERGLGRIASHNIIGKTEPLLDGDEIHFYPCKTGTDAIANEYRLIRQYRPRLNKSIPTLENVTYFAKYSTTVVNLSIPPKAALPLETCLQ
jgi:excinuclease UvrABC nuclease subunit